MEASEQSPPERRSAPTGPEDAAVSRDRGTPDTALDDADDRQGFHFRNLIRKRATWYWGGIPTVVAAAVLAIAAGPIWIPIILVAGPLITLVVCWFIANERAEDDFFIAYAKQRGLTRTESGQLPGSTPLLRKGDERQAAEILAGPLGEGTDGTVALYTYTEVYHDKNGRHETDYHFTVAMTDLPECRERLPELYANRKFGLRVFEKLEDVFRSKARVELESEELDTEYEIFAAKGQDQNFLRQLFSPTFIVWMTDQAPEKFAFELEGGVLCCNVKGHKKSAADLDVMRASASHIANRIREEVREGASAAGA
jgi:hypothetical protein